MYIVIIEKQLKMQRSIIKNPRFLNYKGIKNIQIILRKAGKTTEEKAEVTNSEEIIKW